MKDYYEILGINQDASVNEVKTAYIELISKYHPENFVGEAKEIVEQRIEEVKEAYSILSDDFLRNQYNKEMGIISNVKKTNKKVNVEREKIETEDEKEYAEEKRAKTKKRKSKVGTARGLMDVAEAVFSNIPKIKLKKPTKKGVLSLLAAIAIIALIGIILWFIPFTNGFMRSFLLMD